MRRPKINNQESLNPHRVEIIHDIKNNGPEMLTEKIECQLPSEQMLSQFMEKNEGKLRIINDIKPAKEQIKNLHDLKYKVSMRFEPKINAKLHSCIEECIDMVMDDVTNDVINYFVELKKKQGPDKTEYLNYIASLFPLENPC